MRPTELHDYKGALSDFVESCQKHGWTITDTSAVSPNEWLGVKLHCKVVDATEDPIVARTSVTFQHMRNEDVKNPLNSLASYSKDVATAAEIQWFMSEWKDRFVAWPGKLSAAQKRIINLLRDGHEITYDKYLSPRRYCCNGVKLNNVAMGKLLQSGMIPGLELVRLPDPDPAQ